MLFVHFLFSCLDSSVDLANARMLGAEPFPNRPGFCVSGGEGIMLKKKALSLQRAEEIKSSIMQV